MPKSPPYLKVAQRNGFQFHVAHGMVGEQQLLAVTDQSGHYKPNIEITYRLLKFLKRKSVSLDEVVVKLSALGEKDYINAQAFLDGVVDAIKKGMVLKEAIEHAARSAEPVDPPNHLLQIKRIAVQAPDYQLYAGLDRQELATHSVVTSGGPVRWAGELVTVTPDLPDVRRTYMTCSRHTACCRSAFQVFPPKLLSMERVADTDRVRELPLLAKSLSR